MTARHGLHLYQSAAHLAGCVAPFALAGLRRGDPVILVPARQHREGLGRAFLSAGVDLEAQVLAGRILLGDADELAQRAITAGSVAGIWDEFLRVLGAAGDAVTIWGETPCVLSSRGHFELHRDLELRWCDAVAKNTCIDLLCSYRADPLDPRIYQGELQAACAHHTHVHASEATDHLEQHVTAALDSVLGPRLTGMAMSLADGAPPATNALPPAVSRLLWLERHMPSTWKRVIANARQRVEEPA